MIRALDTTSSALVAQRIRMDVIAGNIANAYTTQQDDGTVQPYRRRVVLFAQGDGEGGAGVHVAAVREDQSPFKLRHDPEHPHAQADGYVQLPNVNIPMEYIDAMEASRAYEANIAMMGVTKQMVQQALRLLA